MARDTLKYLEKLDLFELDKGAPAITPDWGASLRHCASICLEFNNHNTPVQLFVDGDFSRPMALHWSKITDQQRKTWADMQVTTENGACGVAILLIKQLTGLTVIERAKKREGGHDYWLGQEDDDPYFQRKDRLEVSGILNGSETDINARVKQKLAQVESDGLIKGCHIIITEFAKPVSRFIRKEG